MTNRKWLTRSLLLFLIACLLAAIGGLGYFFLWPRTVETRPAVLIQSPLHNAEVELGRPVIVQAVANDVSKIKRIELWVDGNLYQAQDSALPDGTSPFPLVVSWQPSAAGRHTLTARAFNTQNTRTQASIEVEAITAIAQGGDADGDGVGDSQDACPDQLGTFLAWGCPDADGDGIGDSEDGCPNEPGLIEFDGCPRPDDRDGDTIPDDLDECPDTAGTLLTEGCPDADGDTIPDFADLCPDTLGAPEGDGCPTPDETDRDGDGVPDSEDTCPDEGGSAISEGCPDADGDGTRNVDDECPDEPGLPGFGGCPLPAGSEDRDGDGVGDEEDDCPDEPGLPELAGCPDEASGEDSGSAPGGDDALDSDGDGVPDTDDICPDEAGLPEHEGCPAPGDGEDEDGDGVPDDEGGPSDESGPSFLDMDLASIMSTVEFQALRFEVNHDYDGMYCYPSLTGAAVDRYTFEPLGERQWDIAADLGSKRVMLLPTEDLQVSVACGGDNMFMGPEGGWGTYWDLGSAVRSHPASDWDGHVITVRSSGGDSDRWFEAQYRICIDSCEDTMFPAPTISLFHFGGDSQLIMMWGGDRSAIDGFWVYADGRRAFRLPADTTSQSIAGYEPLCGSGRREFHVTAYRGDRESPPSNLAYWSRQPCPRVVRVTFDQIETFALDDERRMDGQLGPVFGSFWAQGSEDGSLRFDGTDYPNGFKFDPYAVYSVQDMFDRIGVWVVQNVSPSYSSPTQNTITVAVGPHDDLTFGGVIYDMDRRMYEEAFLGSHTIPAGEIAPGRYTIQDGQFELSVLLDVVVGPEAGAQPDLTITDVTAFEGQLRIHVFNNAATLANRDVAVNLVRISTNEIIDTVTWENVTIPAGGQRILQSSELTLEPYDLRVILDPDNRIEEMNEGNNIFETPVLVRVEMTGLRVPGWPCEGFLHQNGEVWFQFSVGYGPSADEVRWVAHRVRHPASGVIRWNRNDNPPLIWSLEGQELTTFEFEMPASDTVYLYFSGYEQDGLTNDSMGYIEVNHGPDANFGARAEAHHARSVGRGTTECDQVVPFSLSYFGFEAWWRITRLH